jgi:hypothetical protein
LTCGELLQSLFNQLRDLPARELAAGFRIRTGTAFDQQGIQRVVLFVVLFLQGGQQGRPQRAHLLAPVVVANGVLQNALEQ